MPDRGAPAVAPTERPPLPKDELVTALRRSGCVFAEEEAEVLHGAARDDRQLESMLRSRIAGEPLEHVVRQVAFRGLLLAVGPGVFVPRQRSVHLVDAALEVARRREPRILVEAFAGVAPIATCLTSELPGAEIHAIEADPRAIQYARKNLGPGRVHEGDVLLGLPRVLLGRIDVIVAVPPYVPQDESRMLPREARDHEPGAALFGGQDGLDLVRELLDQAGNWLVPGGRILLEMHRSQVERIAAEAAPRGWSSTVYVLESEQTVVLELWTPWAETARSSGQAARSSGRATGRR